LIVAAMIAQGHGDAKALGDPENAFGYACRVLLFPGALGLMIASILAANMSTCSAFLVDSGALFTEGLYRQRLVPNRPDRHYLWVGRVSGFVITMAGVLYAMYLIESVLYTFLLTETLATFVGISILGGLLWPRANRWGALASLVSSLAANFLLYYATGQRLDHWDANVFLAALVVGIVALVGVSLMTAPEPAAQIDSFFARLQTSSDDYSGYDDAVAAAKKEVVVARPLLLVNLLRLRTVAAGRGWRAFREDITGFAIGWAIVFVLVGGTMVLLAF
jgi:Na+/proline symporter